MKVLVDVSFFVWFHQGRYLRSTYTSRGNTIAYSLDGLPAFKCDQFALTLLSSSYVRCDSEQTKWKPELLLHLAD
jgi:hypothetical protein